MKQYTQQQLKYLSENFQQSQRAMQSGSFIRAEKYFLDVLKIGPVIIEAQNAKATAQFKKLLSANPNHSPTHHNLANSLQEQ